MGEHNPNEMYEYIMGNFANEGDYLNANKMALNLWSTADEQKITELESNIGTYESSKLNDMVQAEFNRMQRRFRRKVRILAEKLANGDIGYPPANHFKHYKMRKREWFGVAVYLMNQAHNDDNLCERHFGIDELAELTRPYGDDNGK